MELIKYVSIYMARNTFITLRKLNQNSFCQQSLIRTH